MILSKLKNIEKLHLLRLLIDSMEHYLDYEFLVQFCNIKEVVIEVHDREPEDEVSVFLNFFQKVFQLKIIYDNMYVTLFFMEGYF